jgi:hypothetical protein
MVTHIFPNYIRLFPSVLKHVVGYLNHRVPYADFQPLLVVVFDLLDKVMDLPNHMLSGG